MRRFFSTRNLRDYYLFKTKRSATIGIVFLMILLTMLILIQNSNTTVELDDNNINYRFVLNDKFQLYELNRTIYPVNNDFRSKINKMYKLVHLDLKGSPPKIKYLKNLINYFHEIGINGVLIEYEDMFPFSDKLAKISNGNAYKKEELEEIFNLLVEKGFLIIPLIQTYGHLEFVLKLNEFKHLRELEQHYQVITPCLEDSYELVIFRIIDQILELHPQSIQYIHIGCDEVYHINKHFACKSLNLFTVQEYFIYHVKKVTEYIKKKRPNLKVIIWEDMIRKHFDLKNQQQLKSFTNLIEPMIWDYNENLRINENIWIQYSQIFNKVWLAGSFKGATFQKALLPNVTKHYMNNLQWMRIIHKMQNKLDFNGIVYTGWSRYDHLLPICEIIPAAIPSLVFLLKVFTNYGDLEASAIQFKELTSCNYKKNSIGFLLEPTYLHFGISALHEFRAMELLTYECTFPGSYLYDILLNLKILTELFELHNQKYTAILNDYNLSKGYINSMIYEYCFYKFYPHMKNEFEDINEEVDVYFNDFFYEDLAIEFKNIYIKPYIDSISGMMNKLNLYKAKDYLPVRPYV